MLLFHRTKDKANSELLSITQGPSLALLPFLVPSPRNPHASWNKPGKLERYWLCFPEGKPKLVKVMPSVCFKVSAVPTTGVQKALCIPWWWAQRKRPPKSSSSGPSQPDVTSILRLGMWRVASRLVDSITHVTSPGTGSSQTKCETGWREVGIQSPCKHPLAT